MDKCPECGFSLNSIPSDSNAYIQAQCTNVKHIEMKYEEKILLLENEIVKLKNENDSLKIYKLLNYSIKVD